MGIGFSQNNQVSPTAKVWKVVPQPIRISPELSPDSRPSSFRYSHRRIHHALCNDVLACIFEYLDPPEHLQQRVICTSFCAAWVTFMKTQKTLFQAFALPLKPPKGGMAQISALSSLLDPQRSTLSQATQFRLPASLYPWLSSFPAQTIRGLQLVSGTLELQRLSGFENLQLLKLRSVSAPLDGLLSVLPRLQVLELFNVEFTDTSVGLLSLHCTSLTMLGLAENKLTDVGVNGLSTALTQLRVLRLSGNRLTSTGLECLSSHLTNLVELDVSHQPAGLKYLGCLSQLWQLRELNLNHCEIDDDGEVEALTSLTSLTSLDLSHNPVYYGTTSCLPALESHLRVLKFATNGGAMRVMATSSVMARLTLLTELDLYNNNLGSSCAGDLSPLVHLRSLNLDSNSIGASGAKHLTSLRRLTRLDLRGNDVEDAGLEALSRYLTALTLLNVCDNHVTARGTSWLTSLVQLVELDLSCNTLGDTGLRGLSVLQRLKVLSVSSCGLGPGVTSYLGKLTALTHLNASFNSLGSANTGSRSLSLTSLPIFRIFDLASSVSSTSSSGSSGSNSVSCYSGSGYRRSAGTVSGPQGLTSLVHLKVLNLRKNHLESPEVLCLTCLCRLTTLDLRLNSISLPSAALQRWSYVSKLWYDAEEGTGVFSVF